MEQKIIQLLNSELEKPGNKNLKPEELRSEVKEILHHLNFDDLGEKSLIFFVSKHYTRLYALPFFFRKRVYINQHFYLKPITPLFNSSNQFLLLYFNQRQARIYEVVNNDLNRKAIIKNEFKTAGNDKEKAFINQIADKIKSLSLKKNLPTVIAGKKKSIRELVKQNEIDSDYTIELSGGKLDLRLLRTKIRKLSERIRKRNKELSLRKLMNSEKYPSIYNEEEIITSANKGLLDTLFLEKESDFLGEYDRENNYVFHSENDEEASSLSNLAAIETILHGGNVYTLNRENLPGNVQHLVAITKN